MRARTEPALAPSLTRVLDAEERAYYWDVALRLWCLPSSSRGRHFPGSHPVPVDARTCRLLRHDAYVVALKTDGVRFLLLLTLAKGSADPIALMIDRRLTMYEVAVWANYDFFRSGTLYDGELAWNVDDHGELTHTMSYCVFDVISVTGTHVATRPFAERLQVIYDTLFRTWRPLAHDADVEAHVRDEHKVLSRQCDPHALTFSPKAQVPFAQMEALWAHRRTTCAQRVDGLLFTARQAPMHIGRTDAILKWKPVHTIDVALRRAPAARDGGAARGAAGGAVGGAARGAAGGEANGEAGGEAGVDETVEVLVDVRARRRAGAGAGAGAGTALERVPLLAQLARLPAAPRAIRAVVVASNELVAALATSGEAQVVECIASTRGGPHDAQLRLTPVRWRGDKAETNAPQTIASTLSLPHLDLAAIRAGATDRKRPDPPRPPPPPPSSDSSRPRGSHEAAARGGADHVRANDDDDDHPPRRRTRRAGRAAPPRGAPPA